MARLSSTPGRRIGPEYPPGPAARPDTRAWPGLPTSDGLSAPALPRPRAGPAPASSAATRPSTAATLPRRSALSRSLQPNSIVARAAPSRTASEVADSCKVVSVFTAPRAAAVIMPAACSTISAAGAVTCAGRPGRLAGGRPSAG